MVMPGAGQTDSPSATARTRNPKAIHHMDKFKNLLGAFVLLAGGMTAADVAGPAVSRPAKPYNVLVVIIDDVAANLNSVEDSSSPVRTPNMERLAAKGTWFT